MSPKTDEPLVWWDDDARRWRLMADVLAIDVDFIGPHPADDVVSSRFDLRDMMHFIGTSTALADDEVERAADGIPLRLRDCLAPR